jgi:hypothetical protein
MVLALRHVELTLVQEMADRIMGVGSDPRGSIVA